MKNDKLMKLHTWIIFGVALLFTGIAFLVMFFMSTGNIKAKQDAINKQKDDLKATPKTKGEIAMLEEQRGKLETQRGVLWLDNYERQAEAKVFDWPPSADRNFNALGTNPKLKFGDPILVNESELAPQTLLKAFDEGYKRMARDIAPARFTSGDWKSTLRYVSNWGTRTTVEVPWMWMALEDYWVQRAILLPIKQFIDDASLFADVTPKPEKGVEDNPLNRTFRNRAWELKLEVGDPQGKPTIRGSLRNLSPRLRTLGVEKQMAVKIWFKDRLNEEPDFLLMVRGENVGGSGLIDIPPESVKNVAELNKFFRVQQLFDEATVPVRLINTLELNMLDHKNRAATLEMAAHIQKWVDENAAVATPAASEPTGGMSSPSGMPTGLSGGLGGASGDPGSVPGAKSGSWQTVLQGNKARYVKRTTDVRRMPIAISVVVETDAANELLVAFANSPLRYQITQTLWQRYNGTLPGVASRTSLTLPTTSGLGGMPSSPGGMGPGGDGGDDGPMGSRPGGAGMPPSAGMPPPGAAGSGLTATVGINPLPSEANAGLSELAIYGVLSLYEKADKPPEAAAATPTTEGTAPALATSPAPATAPDQPNPAPTPPTAPPAEPKK